MSDNGFRELVKEIIDDHLGVWQLNIVRRISEQEMCNSAQGTFFKEHLARIEKLEATSNDIADIREAHSRLDLAFEKVAKLEENTFANAMGEAHKFNERLRDIEKEIEPDGVGSSIQALNGKVEDMAASLESTDSKRLELAIRVANIESLPLIQHMQAALKPGNLHMDTHAQALATTLDKEYTRGYETGAAAERKNTLRRCADEYEKWIADHDDKRTWQELVAKWRGQQ